jgi:hypothetical protein
MGKAKKAHRKKIQNRNQTIKNNQKAFEKAFLAARELHRTQQTYQPSNYLALTGSEDFVLDRDIDIV